MKYTKIFRYAVSILCYNLLIIIIQGSVLTTDHLEYLSGFLHDAIGKLTQLALQLEINLDPGTVKQDTAFSILIKEITENKKVTPKELAAALRSSMVGEGQLAKKIEQEFGEYTIECYCVNLAQEAHICPSLSFVPVTVNSFEKASTYWGIITNSARSSQLSFKFENVVRLVFTHCTCK